MPVQTAIWRVGAKPEALPEMTLANEQLLEDMIVADPRILSDEWMLIGRQEDTGSGGRVDLLAVAPDGSLVLIELKRNRTPRDVVAQSLDYAAWVQQLQPEAIAGIYQRYAQGRSLRDDFRARFRQPLDEETLNASHQIVVVASSLDPSTERIVGYLSDRDIPINVLCFQVFGNGNEQLLSRAWLIDPIRVQVAAVTRSDRESEPWNGEFYSSFGDSRARSWDDAVKYGFISAGGGAWYSRTLELLNPGDRVWVKVPGAGYVGVARVTGRRQSASEYMVQTPQGERSILDVETKAEYNNEDSERAEYFVPVKWLQAVPIAQAVQEVGMFGNQNSVCKPTTPGWRATVERLKERFPKYNE